MTVEVSSIADPAAGVGPAQRAKAIYAAGVRTQLLDGILERPSIAALREQRGALSETPESTPISVANPSSSALLEAFADHYSSAIAASGLAELVAAGELISPTAVEALTLSAAAVAAAQYISLAATWDTLLERIDDGEALSFVEAFAVQSQLAYAEGIISPAVAAGEIVRAARAADLGWQDAEVQAAVAELAEQASCGSGATALRGALEAASLTGVDGLIALDAELRAGLPVYGLANDSALCRAARADAENSQFLQVLAIADSSEIRQLLALDPPELSEAPSSHRLRIIARLGEDGHIEHGVELADGERILPSARLLPTDAAVDRWMVSSAVEVDGNPIGQIRTRRLADGRVELGFRNADGDPIAPDIRYLPADIPVGVWLRSSEIEVPPAELALE